MKKIIQYVGLFYLTGITATNGLPVISGGCSSHMNKQEEIICDKDDTECQIDKVEKMELNKTVRSWNWLNLIWIYLNSIPIDLLEFISV